MNLPKLRFKDNDGRGFPEWEEKELGDVIEQMQSGVSRLLNDSDIGLPVIRSTNLINGKLNISDLKYWFAVDNQGANLENYFLKEGDLLVNFINSLAQIGKVALYEDLLKRNTIFTTNIMRLSFKRDVNYRFIFCFFQTHHYEQHIQAITKPAVNQASFTTKEFKTLKVPFPSLQEQTKIANFLTAIDEKITQLTQKYDLLKQYKKGVMQQIFSQKLRFKDDEGREFPEWEVKTLSETAISITNGLSTDQVSDGVGYKVTRIETISDKEINLKKIGYIRTEKDISEYKLRTGDILFSNINSISHIGKVAYVNTDYDLYHGMNLLRIIIDVFSNNPKFVFYQLSTTKLKQNFETRANKAVNQASINQTELKKTELVIPSLFEQTKIANFLTAIDDKITHTQAQLEAVKLYKKGLLQQMFV